MLLAILPSFSLAGELEKAYTPPAICFTEPVAKELVVELERCRILKQQLDLYRQSGDELVKQINQYEQINRLLTERIAILEKQIEEQRTLMNETKKLHQKELDEARPSFMTEVLKGLGFIGAGILIGILL